jgi:hypothetical protein
MREIIAWILVGVLLFFGGLMTYETISRNSKLNTAITERHDSSMLYIALRHALDHMIVIHTQDSSLYDSVINHKPKPVYYAIHDTVHDSIPGKPKFCESVYSDNVKEGRFSFSYDAFITDCYLKNIRFRNFIYPSDTIKPPVLPPKDTCISKPKSLWSWDWEVTPRIDYNPFDNSFGVMGEGELSYGDIVGILELGATTKKQAEFNIGIGYKFHKK